MRGAWVGSLLGLVCAAAIAAGDAPPVTLASAPSELARAAVGDLRGSASVGVWRDGKASFAGLRDGAPVPAADVGGPGAALFEIGSISKLFTAVLLAQAVERGELRLDDTLGQLLTGKVEFGSAKVAAITLRQLITHTSCLPRLPPDLHAAGTDMSDPYRGYDRVRLWKMLSTLQVAIAPPCEAEYSNLGVGLVGDLLSLRYGQPWASLVHERIAAPLGMADTVVALGDKAARLAPAFDGDKPVSPWAFDALVGAGGLRSTAADMLIFGRAILAGHNGPLGAAAARIVTPLARFNGDIGYAIFIAGPPERRTWQHNGATGGYRAQLLIAADAGEVLVVLASNARAPVDALTSALLTDRYPVPAAVPGTRASCLSECAGVYRIGRAAAYSFGAQGDTLHSHYSGRGFVALAPSGTDAFTHATDTRFVFERDAAGRPNALRVTSRGAELQGVRTDEPAPARITLADAQALAGRYRLSPTLLFDVQPSDGQLRVQLGAQPRLPVYAVAGVPDRFGYDAVKAELQFERDDAGKVVALVLIQNGRHRAPKVDSPFPPEAPR